MSGSAPELPEHEPDPDPGQHHHRHGPQVSGEWPAAGVRVGPLRHQSAERDPPEGTRIGRYVYGGSKRCLYPVEKFESNPERQLAVILERDAVKWFRPARNQFFIYYRSGGTQHEYKPDFVAESADTISAGAEGGERGTIRTCRPNGTPRWPGASGQATTMWPTRKSRGNTSHSPHSDRGEYGRGTGGRALRGGRRGVGVHQADAARRDRDGAADRAPSPGTPRVVQAGTLWPVAVIPAPSG